MRFFSYGHFNPRSLVGNDVAKSLFSQDLEISIHVPSWGTTVSELIEVPAEDHFNPRSLVGND